MTQSRANLFRYPPGAIGRRHIDPIQEEVFVVLDGTLTIHMGEGDGSIEQHELAKGSVLVVQPGTALQLSNRHDDELRLFIVGAPPERGDATFLEHDRVSAFDDVRSIVPRRVWDGITARAVHGERLTLALVELEPGAIAETHSHDHEQLGLVLRGSIRFRVGDEERELGPGETWEIPSNTPHRAEAGPDGASVLDLFAPPPFRVGAGRAGRARTGPLALQRRRLDRRASRRLVSSPGSLFTIGGSM